MNAEKKLQVTVKYGELRADYEGSPDEVLRGVIDFLKRVHPALEVVEKISLTTDLNKLLKSLEGLVAVQPSGPVILYEKKMTIEQTISLLLGGAYASCQLNALEQESLTLDTLSRLTGKTGGALRGTLSRMKEKQMIERLPEGGYRITPLGLKRLVDDTIPALKVEVK
jgi:hypothetical protein